MSGGQKRNIYIVVSKTDTVLGRLIQKKLGVEYNHCSISLDESLEDIYSFGRKELWNMFRAGFVKESKSEGFFKKYNNSDIAVMRVPVTQEQLQEIAINIARFQVHKELYSYNALGLIYCYLGINAKRKNKYFCSQFVAEVLEESGVWILNKPQNLVRPHDFLRVDNGQIIYTGEIGKYCSA